MAFYKKPSPFYFTPIGFFMSVSIVLASSSRYRASLLSKIIQPISNDNRQGFLQLAPNIDERAKKGETPQSLVTRLSIEKAKAIQLEYSNAIIIASDQVACSPEGKIIGKPHSVERAISQLTSFSGKKITFFTGLCVCTAQNNDTGPLLQKHIAVFSVYFRTLSREQIQYYVEQEKPLDCAGSFKSEGLGISLFERFEGEDPNALVGLPLMRLCNMLKNIGYDVLSPTPTQK